MLTACAHWLRTCTLTHCSPGVVRHMLGVDRSQLTGCVTQSPWSSRTTTHRLATFRSRDVIMLYSGYVSSTYIHWWSAVSDIFMPMNASVRLLSTHHNITVYRIKILDHDWIRINWKLNTCMWICSYSLWQSFLVRDWILRCCVPLWHQRYRENANINFCRSLMIMIPCHKSIWRNTWSKISS